MKYLNAPFKFVPQFIPIEHSKEKKNSTHILHIDDQYKHNIKTNMQT